MRKILFLVPLFTVLSMMSLQSCTNKNNDEYYDDDEDYVDDSEETSLKVRDICGNIYPVVKIGNQYWMAENMRCNKYDTQSEAYKASWLINNTLPTTEDYIYTPDYIDATDKSKWKYTDHVADLSDDQISKLGYLYNWAAAVGVENGEYYGTTPFTGNRQGICPNGWHVPSKAEFQTLYDYIYSDKDLLEDQVGKYLKTKSGWYQNGNGIDGYYFAALPSGYMGGGVVYNVGDFTEFWTVTPTEVSSHAYYIALHYDRDYLSKFFTEKDYGISVRCVKD